MSLDVAAVRDYVARSCSQVSLGPLSAIPVHGGRSNLTYFLTDGESEFVLRRPPAGRLLSTAHDMRREFTVLRALAGSRVPVPRTYGYCDDPSILGVPFFLMERVAGVSYRGRAQLSEVGASRSAAISAELVRTLATLHSLDPVALGLSDFGNATGFLQRHIERWNRQYNAAAAKPSLASVELYSKLRKRAPREHAAALLHGDYRLDNLLISDGDTVSAVLDWELATLGDPITDLALLLAYQHIAPLVDDVIADASSAPGFLPADDLLTLYEVERDCRVGDLNFYLGLAAFKIAAILQGIHLRNAAGQSTEDVLDSAGCAVGPVLQAGLDWLKER